MINFRTFFENRFYNDTLHPDFWSDSKEFDSEIREKLLTIAMDVAEEAGVEKLVEDVQLTGSLSNYNYTEFSDLDVHILLDFDKINNDEELVKKALDGKRFIWNQRHDIIINDHEVEIYFQDIDEPHKASGLYSILKDEWITEPEHNEPSVDVRDVELKADKIKSEISDLDMAMQTASYDDLESMRDEAQAIRSKITKMRRDSLDLDGEFGIGNLAFKELRNSNYIERLIDISTKLYDDQFSSN
ncbi:hypothetical protein N9273_00110 [bacterium]|nr:hypothetical protein [bacterium]